MSKDFEVNLTRYCGICGRVFSLADRCVALIGNPAATAYRLTTSPFRYPAPPRGPHKDKVDGLYLCPFSSCSRAKSTPESATFHHDCFEVFKSACTGADALDRLWSFAVWQRPWRDAARIFLPRKPAICSAGVGAAARALGLRAFAERLPVEIASMVYEYSESATFWRLASALDLAAQFSAAGERGITTHALRRVASWERGQAPVLSREQHQFPIIRLTIDALGIKSVERLPGDEPPLSKARSDNLAFVIEHQADIGPGHVVVLFKNGRARLKLQPSNPGFQIWDTPNLPRLPQPPGSYGPGKLWSTSVSLWGSQLSEWRLYGFKPHYTTRFRTINLSSISGLTFFYGEGTEGLLGIHAHTPAAPPLAMAPESAAWQHKHVWSYVPVSRVDKITAIVATQRAAESRSIGGLLIRTRLGGITPVGPLGPLGRWGCQKYTLGNSPETIIHDADDACGVTLIGAYPRALPEELDAAIQEFPLTRTVPATFDGHYGLQLSMHFSSAPLADVTAAEVFRRGPGPYSRGILLTYGNGGQRALGECRLGVDSSRRYEWPRLLCTTMESKRSEVPPNRRLWTAMVQFKDAQAHEHDGDGWKCYDMSGTLNFWFTHNQQYLEVVLA